MTIDLRVPGPARQPGSPGTNALRADRSADGQDDRRDRRRRRILNSAGQLNEAEAFRKPARWVDYSGPITHERRPASRSWITRRNPNHPSPFKVRDNGWMGVSLTLDCPCRDYAGQTPASSIMVVHSPATCPMRTNSTNNGRRLLPANWPR